MALITQNTNLKSLKYGGDKPYVTKDINDTTSSRGLQQQAEKRLEDLERITKVLSDTPGTKFLSNQALLLQTDIRSKIEKSRREGNSLGKEILNRVGQTAKKTAQIIGSTLAQVPVNGTGTHFVQGFRTDTYLKGAGQQSGFLNFLGKGGVEGSQYAIRGENIPVSRVDSNFESGEVQDRSREEDKYSRDERYIENNVNPIQASTSGEKIYGDNTSDTYQSPTPSRVVEQDSQFKLKEEQDSSRELSKEGQNIATGTVQTTKQPGEIGKEPTEGEFDGNIEKGTLTSGDNTIQDFRNPDSKEYQGRTSTYSFNYRSKTVNKEKRVGLGRQGKRITFNPDTKYTETDPESIDKVNQLGVLDEKPGIDVARDLINFNIQVITPENTKYLYFRAYLDSFDDSHSGVQEETRYIGRGDAFYTYGGYSRTMNTSFKVAASTREEMKPLYQKINYLASATAPTYSNDNFMRGTIVKITIGDYIYEVPAVLTNVTYNWITDYPWEISMSNPESNIDDDMQVVPHVLDCSFSANIIHQFTPETGNNPFITNPFGNQRGKEVWIPGNF